MEVVQKIENKLVTGQIVWARVTGHPWWPGIVK